VRKEQQSAGVGDGREDSSGRVWTGNSCKIAPWKFLPHSPEAQKLWTEPPRKCTIRGAACVLGDITSVRSSWREMFEAGNRNLVFDIRRSRFVEKSFAAVRPALVILAFTAFASDSFHSAQGCARPRWMPPICTRDQPLLVRLRSGKHGVALVPTSYYRLGLTSQIERLYNQICCRRQFAQLVFCPVFPHLLAV
jgi:hypothetical protein